nr:hypothetical protein CFP56_05469 [Quercus suber]
MYPKLPIGPRNVPPEPGDTHNASWSVPNEVHDDMPTVTFWQAVQYWWRNLWNQQAPQVEGLISSLCALSTFTATPFYLLKIGGHVSVVFMVAILHTVALQCLLLFGFFNAACERYRKHFMFKSVGDFIIMFGLCFLTSEIGRKLMSPFEAPYPVKPTYHQKIKFSEIAGVVTSLLFTVDALSIINLLKPGHHYFIFEVTATLTMDLSLDLLLNRKLFYGAFAVSLIFLIVVFKNFIWRNVVNGQVPVNQQRHLPLVPAENIA